MYKGHCLTCEEVGKNSVYVRESSRSGYVRGKQHLEAIKDHHKHQSNAFGIVNKRVFFNNFGLCSTV